MKLKLEDLNYYLIPGKPTLPENDWIYNEAYRMWREVWSATFRELDGDPTIYNDDFARQTHIGAVFHKEECVAMTTFNHVDFRIPTAHEDSYFKIWNQEALSELTSEGKRIVICSHLTVAPNWRGKTEEGLSLKFLVADLSIRYFLNTDCNAMTGTMRNDRGAQNAAYMVGASPIQKDAQMHGVAVDLVGIFRSRVLANKEIPDHLWTRSLWNSRIDLGTQTAQNTKILKKTA